MFRIMLLTDAVLLYCRVLSINLEHDDDDDDDESVTSCSAVAERPRDALVKLSI